MSRRKGWGLALVAAWLLVLQSAIGAFASGEMPVSAQRDAFGNPLCISAHHSDTGDHGGGDRQAADCCLSGCCMSQPLLPTTADAGSFLPVFQSSGARQFPPSEIQFRAREHHPGYPRAPPTLIA
ncbi:hypothetical protein LCM4579_02870 [Ensifer sp. LCM 4579]|nr:hypothetical protein LCM4579_02870 [Ensifer sp. LCM 4579]